MLGKEENQSTPSGHRNNPVESFLSRAATFLDMTWSTTEKLLDRKGNES